MMYGQESAIQPVRLEARSSSSDVKEDIQQEGDCMPKCILCCFGCLTICGCKNLVCQNLVFFPPSPPFYEFRGNDFYRVQAERIPQEGPIDEDERLMFKRVRVHRKLGLETFTIPTRRKQNIAALYISFPKAKQTVLFSHGNATDLGLQSFYLEAMALELQVNVLAYDYTGYGSSSNFGKPTPADLYADCEAAFNFLTTEKKTHPTDIILYGQSLGSSAAIHLGALHKVLGIVIHSGLLSGVRVLQPDMEETKWFDIFPNIDRIRNIKAPAFIIHGEYDEAVPFSHGEKLYEAAAMKIEPWWVRGANHNNIESIHEDTYFPKLRSAKKEFIKVMHGS